MKYIVITFISILTFIVPVNVNAQDSEDVAFEFLFQANIKPRICQEKD